MKALFWATVLILYVIVMAPIWIVYLTVTGKWGRLVAGMRAISRRGT